MPSSPLNFHDARALIIDTAHERRNIKFMLRDLKLYDVIELDGAFDQWDRTIELQTIDLIIANVSEMDSSALQFISDIRWRRIPSNPFTVVVLTSNTPNEGVINQSIDSGVDAILLKPFSPHQLKQHILALTDRRRPFIVTADYVGPERRSSDRADASALRNFEVPNTLRNKMHGEGAGSYALIDIAWQGIEHELVNRIAYQILFFIRLLEIPTKATTITAIRGELARFPEMAKSLLSHLTEREHKTIGLTLMEWLARYPKLVGDESRGASRAASKDLIDALLNLIGSDSPSGDILAEIDTNVANFLQRITARSEALAS